MIPKEIYERYHLADITEYESEYVFYYTFLIQTDHIPNKIIESQVLGETPEDYTKILQYRQFARDEINRLNTPDEMSESGNVSETNNIDESIETAVLSDETESAESNIVSELNKLGDTNGR